MTQSVDLPVAHSGSCLLGGERGVYRRPIPTVRRWASVWSRRPSTRIRGSWWSPPKAGRSKCSIIGERAGPGDCTRPRRRWRSRGCSGDRTWCFSFPARRGSATSTRTSRRRCSSWASGLPGTRARL